MVLAACGGGITGALRSGNGEVSRAVAAPSEVRLIEGRVKVSGPQGYCVDQSETRDTADQAFVVLARCDALGGGGAPAKPGLLTVAVSRQAGSPGEFVSPSALAAFATSREGRAAMAASGRASDLEILDTDISGDMVMMEARERGARNGLAEQHWRALIGRDGYVISARVNAFAEQPMSARTGFKTLKALAGGIKADNAVSNVETNAVVAETETKSGIRRPGIFARIFR